MKQTLFLQHFLKNAIMQLGCKPEDSDDCVEDVLLQSEIRTNVLISVQNISIMLLNMKYVYSKH